MLNIHDLYFDYNQNFDDFEVDTESYVVINVTFSLGNELNDSLFYFDFSNDIDLDTDYKLLDDFNIFFREKGIFTFEKFNKHELVKFLTKLIENKISGYKNHQQALLKISEYFNWEYDNYKDIN